MWRYSVELVKVLAGHSDGYWSGFPKHCALKGHFGVPSVKSECEYIAHLGTVPTRHMLSIKSAVRCVLDLAITNRVVDW